MKWKGISALYLFAGIFLLSPVRILGEEGKTIGKFAGYEWGTGYDEITQGEITQENRDRITKKNAGEDWGEELELDMLRIWETEREVGGYELSDITFFFHEGALTGGEYELSYELWEEGIPDLAEKYTEVYGEPIFYKETTNPNREALSLWLWIDKDKNYIFLNSYFGTILYGTPDPVMLDYVDRFAEEGILGEWFHVSIKDEIERIGNLDGI